MNFDRNIHTYTVNNSNIVSIKCLWVDESHQKKYFASKLVDVFLSKYESQGLPLPKESLAISAPTDEGLKFFCAYSKQEYCLAIAE